MSTNTTERGQDSETLALHHLEQQGLRLVMRNYRCKMGELDLIMHDGNELVFVEVRSRRAGGYGSAAESITAAKRRRLIRAAAHYLQRYRIDAPCRFDVIGLTRPDLTRQDDTWHIEWLRDAFRAD